MNKIEDELQCNLAIVFVATHKEKVIGYIYGLESRIPEQEQIEFHEVKTIEMVDLYVDQAFQENGVGTSLVHALIEEARTRGFDKVSLLVLSANEKAVQYYEKLGFQTEAREMSKKL